MTYRRGRPLSVRWLLEPLIGRARVEGPIGHAVDVVAVVGTLFGVATSLGFGITQIAAGLEYLGWITVNNWWTVAMIGIVTAIATASVVSGVSKGPKWLSNINMVLAGALAAFVLLLGPTLFLLRDWVQNLVSTSSGCHSWPCAPVLSPTATGWAAGPSSTGAGGSAGRPSSGCSSPGSPGGARSGSSSARS